MNQTRIYNRTFSCLLLVLGLSHSSALWAGPSPSTTTLTVSGSYVPIRTLLTLTAKVTSVGKPVAPGLVVICSATGKYCQNSAVLGQAQLTKTGIATLHLILPLGEHSIKAVFQGTNSFASNQSSAQNVDVYGKHGTSTTISVTGTPGNYTLTGTVKSLGIPNQTGTVIFPDTTNHDIPLAEAQLGPGRLGVAYVTATSLLPNPEVVADFNGDGWPDMAVRNENGGTTSILLGNGDGTFTLKSSPSAGVGGYQYPMVVGDFNGDDIPDLVVLDVGVTILLGNGDGTFKEATPPATPNYPFAAVVGTLTGMGMPTWPFSA